MRNNRNYQEKYVPVNILSVMMGCFHVSRLNQYNATDKVSCSRTQHSDFRETRTSSPLIPNQTLNQGQIKKISVYCFW